MGLFFRYEKESVLASVQLVIWSSGAGVQEVAKEPSSNFQLPNIMVCPKAKLLNPTKKAPVLSGPVCV